MLIGTNPARDSYSSETLTIASGRRCGSPGNPSALRVPETVNQRRVES
jgi:hypothetical protein